MVTKLQSLTALWQEFDLPGTQKLLDELATDITARQDESDASRKLLIELMRNFKKSNTEETRHAVAPLLKSFQNEVDSLSKRSKAAEKAFFDIYKKFCDIADPVPTLEYCMETQKSLHKIQDLEIETKQLRETITDYNTEIQAYKLKEKKLEELEKKCEDYEKGMEEVVAKRVAEKESELMADFDEKVKSFEEEKIMTSQKLVDSEFKAKGLQGLLEDCQNELYTLKSRQDEKREAVSDQMEILMNDLDRSNNRAASAEKEVAALQERIDELKTEGLQVDPEDAQQRSQENDDLKLQLAAKEREVRQLVEDVKKNTRLLQDAEARDGKRLRQLEETIDGLGRKLTTAEEKLAKQADYDSVKKDLSILKTLEFSTSDTGEDGAEDGRPLEVLILERSKALQSENSMLRLDKERQAREMKDLKEEVEGKQGQINKQGELIAQLEDHVEQLQTISTPFREEAEGRSSSDILAEALQVESVHSSFSDHEKSVSPLPGQPADSSSTLLPIVQAQRERFRMRNEELEQIEGEQQQQISLLQREIQDLQQDNVKLFEKIRYLQSCSGPRNKNSQDVVVPVESRYQSTYEQKLDPFSSFSQAEKQRKYGQLSVFEKIILSMVRFMVGNKTARLAVFAYSVLLHCLIFMVTYRLAWTESCRREMGAEWHERYIEHMQHVHGQQQQHHQ